MTLADKDPHVTPLATAIQKGWDPELRKEGGRKHGLDCWLHTTPDNVIHIGWATTFCGIEIDWEHSQHGQATTSTCEECVADFTLMRLDHETWMKRSHQKANPNCDCELYCGPNPVRFSDPNGT